jgi:uncharacterized membrane protein
MGLFGERWRKWFRNQVDSWSEDGIIDSKQRQQILDRYGDNFGPASLLHRNRLVAIVGILGSLLVGIGIILFVAANWQEISPFVKVSIIIASIVVFYGLGFLLKVESGDYPRTGGAFLFLGHMTYGASIWLIAQIFHLSSHYPNGFLYWLIGVLAMSMVLELRSGMVLSAVLLGAWIGAELTYTNEYIHSLSFGNKILSGPVLLFPILAGLLGLGVYRTRSKSGLFLLLFSIVQWLNYLTLIWSPTVEPDLAPNLIVTVLFGMIAYWYGDIEEVFGPWMESSVIYRWTAFLIVFGSLFCLSFSGGTERFLRYSGTLTVLQTPLILFLIMTLAGLGYYQFTHHTDTMRKNTMVEAVSILLIASLLLFGHLLVSDSIVGYVIAINIIAFGTTLGFIAKGYVHGQGSLLVAGLIGFGLLLIARYFDLAWELLSRSFFFMTGGVVLLLISFLFEFSRRRLLDRMDGPDR